MKSTTEIDDVYVAMKAIDRPIKDMLEIILNRLKYLEKRVTILEDWINRFSELNK